MNGLFLALPLLALAIAFGILLPAISRAEDALLDEDDA